MDEAGARGERPGLGTEREKHDPRGVRVTPRGPQDIVRTLETDEHLTHSALGGSIGRRSGGARRRRRATARRARGRRCARPAGRPWRRPSRSGASGSAGRAGSARGGPVPSASEVLLHVGGHRPGNVQGGGLSGGAGAGQAGELDHLPGGHRELGERGGGGGGGGGSAPGGGTGGGGGGGVELPAKSAGEVSTGRFPTAARGQADFDGATRPSARGGWTFPHAEHTSDWISIMLIPPR